MPILSFCTTCMDRLHHLKKTLPNNIKTAIDSGIDFEFCVLNYNSQDDLDNWIKKFPEINYTKTTIPVYWDVGEAKHLCHSSATGDILINVDADNYLSEKYILWVLENVKDGNFAVGNNKPTCGGRLAVTRKDYDEVGGYRSGFIYTGDHQDLSERLVKIGKQIIFTPVEIMSGIEHGDTERYKMVSNNIRSKEDLKMYLRQRG